jgi:hypothetical protein
MLSPLYKAGGEMLPKWAGWIGLILTGVFGGLNVYQFVLSIIRKKLWGSALAQLEQNSRNVYGRYCYW